MDNSKGNISIPKGLLSVLTCILAVLLIIGYYICMSKASIYPDTRYGVPTVSTEHPEMDISIEQVLDDGKYIYILYHHSSGIVRVYDMEGSYQHTLFFYCHLNGFFSMASEEDAIYVQDMAANVYVLRNGGFDRFVEASEAKAEFADIDFRSRASSPNYDIRSKTLWRITDDGEVCIVGNPEAKIVSSVWPMIILCFIIVIGILRLRT